MQNSVLRVGAVLSFGVCLLLTACAPPRTALPPITPLTQTSPTTESSPTTSPSKPPASPTTRPTARPAVLTITSANFHAGEVAIAYSPVTLLASGGVPPYSWSISVGALPTGLSAATAGTVSGTPSAAATYTFTVHVADTAGQTATVNRSVTVVQHVAIRGICTTTTPCAVEAACVICGRFGALSGGVGPFKYALVGTLPSGMGLSGLSLTGPFPPPPVGIAFPPPVRFQLTVTDSFGATGIVLAQFTVFNHLLLPDVTGPTGIADLRAALLDNGHFHDFHYLGSGVNIDI